MCIINVYGGGGHAPPEKKWQNGATWADQSMLLPA